MKQIQSRTLTIICHGLNRCLACPANTYRETSGATELGNCRPCQAKSTTERHGESSRQSCVCDEEYYTISTIDNQDETLTCQICPKGALCGDGKECALRNDGFNCSDKSQIVGNWTLHASGHYELVACPAGYEMRTTAEGSADLQECFKCPAPSTYILRPNEDNCQTCPTGLTCHGDATLEPKVQNSSWLEDAAIFRLQSCPSGYSVSPASVDRDASNAQAALQKCEPCGKGEECSNSTCVLCSLCAAGYYKAAVGTEL